jgi:hypothetical protein
MFNYVTTAYVQSVLVVDSSTPPPPTASPDIAWDYNRSINENMRSQEEAPQAVIEVISPSNPSELGITSTMFASVPVVLRYELDQDYRDLGDALKEMVELDEGDDWRIDTPVYETACLVAAGLRDIHLPAPRVFTHGPKAVVFNWSNDIDNLYLTISADRMSALISTPESITRRIDYSHRLLADPAVAFDSIESAYLGLPVNRLLLPTVPAPRNILD